MKIKGNFVIGLVILFIILGLIWALFVVAPKLSMSNSGLETTLEATAYVNTTAPTESEFVPSPEYIPEITETEPAIETEPCVPTIDILDIEAQYGEAAIYIAKTVWGEARGINAEGQKKVVWCILNRVDDERFPNDIIQVITQQNQFHGYSPNFPCTDELYQLSLEVIAQWQLEKIGGESERLLPPEYVFFYGNGTENIFTRYCGHD
jgi:hypothetical protein